MNDREEISIEAATTDVIGVTSNDEEEVEPRSNVMAAEETKLVVPIELEKVVEMMTDDIELLVASGDGENSKEMRSSALSMSTTVEVDANS